MTRRSRRRRALVGPTSSPLLDVEAAEAQDEPAVHEPTKAAEAVEATVGAAEATVEAAEATFEAAEATVEAHGDAERLEEPSCDTALAERGSTDAVAHSDARSRNWWEECWPVAGKGKDEGEATARANAPSVML